MVCGTIDPGFELHQCLLVGNMEKNCSAAMLAAKRLAGVTPEVNLMETLTHTPPPSVNKTTHSGFETQRRHNQKFKKRPHKKDLCPPKIKTKKIDLPSVFFTC